MSPFHGAGLWLAVIWTPPAARRNRTANLQLGVEVMPTSSTVQPAPTRPAVTAWRSISPLGRLSRERRTFWPRQKAPKAAANRAAASAVSPLPTIPRMPETETIRSLAADMGGSRVNGG